MQDQFARKIDYLRISITDRCNLRCSYCMPAEGVPWLHPREILTYEEILRLVRASIALGFRKFRVTGGEPLVRKGVVDFLKELAGLPGVEDLTITTNGVLLESLAAKLKDAGVRRVNISLDTLDPQKFADITRGGKLSQVLAGIYRSLEVGLKPVKLNVVVMRGFNDSELEDFVQLAREYPLHVRFIELMPIGASDGRSSGMVPVAELKRRLAHVELMPVQGLEGAGPAQHFTGEGLQGSIGFISAISQHFCAQCNRVRLTADGKIKPCLHGLKEVDLKPLLRSGGSWEELTAALAHAVMLKPSRHNMVDEGWEGRPRVMSQIGG